MKTQEDFIRGVVETRRACDEYSKDLTTYSDAGGMESSHDFADMPKDYKGKTSYF